MHIEVSKMGKQNAECHVCGMVRDGSLEADCCFHLCAVESCKVDIGSQSHLPPVLVLVSM